MLENTTYQEWWQQYLAGDRKAFGEFYMCFHRRLTIYCLGILKDHSLAENAASEALTRLLEHDDPKGIKNVESWLFKVARNCCFSLTSMQSRRKSIWEQVSSIFTKMMPHQGEAKMKQKDLHTEIKHILNGLEYEVWQLSQQGYSNEEIAAKIKIAEKTVANNKSNARKKLKTAYQHLRKQL